MKRRTLWFLLQKKEKLSPPRCDLFLRESSFEDPDLCFDSPVRANNANPDASRNASQVPSLNEHNRRSYCVRSSKFLEGDDLSPPRCNSVSLRNWSLLFACLPFKPASKEGEAKDRKKQNVRLMSSSFVLWKQMAFEIHFSTRSLPHKYPCVSHDATLMLGQYSSTLAIINMSDNVTCIKWETGDVGGGSIFPALFATSFFLHLEARFLKIIK